ncbi:hypothetical protein [Rhizobium sp. 18055]|uniref:hypothetical protein n=1 Tax=Rhizobium sp. 18055 TaxID=2681403 RepID=UPI001357950C|nr:hypothetical protein [Rhizobium sp. 18055]
MGRQRLTLCALLVAGWPLLAHADDAADPILPAAITFATSTGYWEDDGSAPAVARAPVRGSSPAANSVPAAAPQPATTQPKARHGYYKLFAVRQSDRTAKVYLQQIAQTDTGPEIVSTVEVQELNDLNPYVTDIRPENSTGRLNEPGLFAMVYLKTHPDGDADSWTVLIDEFGDISVEKSGH